VTLHRAGRQEELRRDRLVGQPVRDWLPSYRDERAPMIFSMTCGFGIGMTFSIVAGTPLTWSAFGAALGAWRLARRGRRQDG
jgi:hypothetical protein